MANFILDVDFVMSKRIQVEAENEEQAKATFESIQNGYKPVDGTTDDVLDNVRMRLGKLNNLMN